MKSPLLIGCDLSTPSCQAELPTFSNKEVLEFNQDALGLQARRVASSGPQGAPVGKSGICGTEELPQNTIIAPCDASDPFQVWTVLPNGTIFLAHTGECLQLDSGQGGHCSQAWPVWTNNVASSLCNDPASSCGGRQELWTYDAPSRHLLTNTTGQCLSVHAGGLHNVGTVTCTPLLSGLQSWDWSAPTGQFMSSAAPPGSGGSRFCLARTKDVRGGALEVWAGPLAGGDLVVALFNRNAPGPANITVQWADLGLQPAASMQVRDVWAHQDLGAFSGSFTGSGVGEHDVMLLRLHSA
jgi:hypothetical protein